MNWLSTVLSTLSRPIKWWVTVAVWEQGVRIRLGKNPKRLDPGIHLRIPFVDRIYVQSTRQRIATVSNQTMSTLDNRALTLTLMVSFRVTDIVAMYRAVAQPEGVLLFRALSAATYYISSRRREEITLRELEAALDISTPGSGEGMEITQVRVVGFAESRCYRLMSGDSWVGTGAHLDAEETTGERR